jgi:hypothetical protein
MNMAQEDRNVAALLETKSRRRPISPLAGRPRSATNARHGRAFFKGIAAGISLTFGVTALIRSLRRCSSLPSREGLPGDNR